jgi:hypothetical protein
MIIDYYDYHVKLSIAVVSRGAAISAGVQPLTSPQLR